VPPSERSRFLCVSLHDVAPATWTSCLRLLSMLEEIGRVPLTLLVVPEYHGKGRIDTDTSFLRRLEERLLLGDEVALHGYYHLDDGPTKGYWDRLQRRLYTAGEGEFAALGAEAARARLERGVKLVERLGWPVKGFVAPAWLLGPGAQAALQELPFQYTTTLRRIYRMPSWTHTTAQSLVYSTRSPWRRIVSRAWNDRLFHRSRNDSVLRISLHPEDARYPGVMGHWRSLIKQALSNRIPLTKTEWLESTASRGISQARHLRG
jgi:predicted deacetylase